VFDSRGQGARGGGNGMQRHKGDDMDQTTTTNLNSEQLLFLEQHSIED
jgi:hypothetical protein